MKANGRTNRVEMDALKRLQAETADVERSKAEG